jgi:hypothetical protein
MDQPRTRTPKVIPRFRFSLLALFGFIGVAAVGCAAGRLWSTWPQRTASAFLAALAEERTEETIGMVRQSESRPYHSFPTQLRLDAQLQIVLAQWRHGKPVPQVRTFSDFLRGRQTFRIPRYIVTVQRGKVIEEECGYQD